MPTVWPDAILSIPRIYKMGGLVNAGSAVSSVGTLETKIEREQALAHKVPNGYCSYNRHSLSGALSGDCVSMQKGCPRYIYWSLKWVT